MSNRPYTIHEIKEIAVPIAKKHGVSSLSLFGSYARNSATDRSDVDFCIDKGKIRGLFQYFAFVHDLENAFGCHVDVVTTGIGDQDFLDQIEKDRIILYEQ